MQTNPKIIFKPITLEENIKIIQKFLLWRRWKVRNPQFIM